jgi:glycosyltransferase involved in cell wall biosynthesis
MSHFPKISIVTPSYNQGVFIERTILSVLNQNYPNLEYIILDGGSSDESVSIIKKYENRISFWESKKDEGQSHAINKGLSMATGEIVTWLNSDDCLLPNTLTKVADIWNKNQFNYLVSHCHFVDENDKLIESQIKSKLINDIHYFPFSSECVINQPGTFFSLKIYKELGPLDQKLHYAMDVDFWLKIAAQNYTFDYVDDYFAYFRRHETTKSSIGNIQFIEDTLKSDFIQNKLVIINYGFYKKVRKAGIDCYLYHLRLDHLTNKLFKASINYFFTEPFIVIKHLYRYFITKSNLFLKNKFQF